MSDKKINIEKLLDELENIVKKMEDDNLNLEQSLESYEKGIGLVKQAQSTLTEIEKKVKSADGSENNELTIDDILETLRGIMKLASL